MPFFSLEVTNKKNRKTQTANLLNDSLLGKIADGDKVALSELYVQTKTAVYGFALSILRNQHSAEDVMQDTYVRIFQSASSYTPQGKPMAWILRIVRNLSLMKLRESEGNTLTLDENFTMAYEEDHIDRLVLESAINILSQEERQIVILHSVAGQKHREIATLLDLPLSTVLSKYRRALSKLRKHLEEEMKL